MMKNLFKFICTIPLFILLVSCASDDEIADELIDYYNNEWIPIHGMKTYEIDTARNTVMDLIQELEENDGNEAIALHEVDVVTIADNIIDRFESIQLKHRKVKKLNNMQIKAEKTGKELANSMIDYANGDIESSKLLQKEYELKRKYDEVHEYLEKLMDTYNLEYDWNNKVDGFYELKHKEK